jgi:hypothetical protein
MDYVAGPPRSGSGQAQGKPESLHDVLQARPESRVSEADARRWAGQVAEALAHAHARGVVHRDIKTGNILLDQDGNARVTDFGLAKAVGEEFLRSQIHTSMARSMSVQRTIAPSARVEKSLGTEPTMKTGGSNRSSADSLLGTYDYMSPEQRGELSGAPVGPASDVYSFGVMLYRMLTGRRPAGMAESPSALVPGLSRTWDALVARCMKHQPAERFKDGAELVSAFSAGQTSTVRRRGLWLGVAAAAVVLVAVLAVPMALRQRDEARRRAASAAETSRAQEERAAKVETLLKAAQAHIGADKLDEALAALAEAVTLEPTNARADKLKQVIEGKAGERKARPAKVDADMAWERLKNRKLDEGQGMGAKLAEVERQWRLAADAYGLAKWGEAYLGYQAVLRLVKEAEGLELAREAAKARRGEAEKSKQTAAMAGAAELAAAEWAEGGRASARALEQFEKGAFPEAGQAWQAASVQWATAEARAEQITAYRKAKTAFDKAVGGTTSVSSADLKEYGGATWEEVERQRRLGEASESDPVVGRKAYESALAKLPEAAREAESGKRKAEEREAAARQAAAEKAARDQALVKYRQALHAAQAALTKAQALARTDAQGPGVVKEGQDAITAFENSASFALIGAPERTALAEVKNALAALTWNLGPKAGDALSLDLGGGVKMELVWIPPGTFDMGSPDTEAGRYSDEGPVHRVTLTQG